MTLAAAALQVARNGLQRSLMAQAGPWGATLVRLLLALPFSAILVVGAAAATPGARPTPVSSSGRRSLGAVLRGALASSGWFTAVALVPAGPVGAVGTVEARLAALAGGRFFGERLAPWRWVARLVALVGLAMTSLG